MSGEIETIYPVICSMGQKPHNYAAFLALLLWWTHILEADFCCIILQIFFRAKVYFFVISYFGAKGSGCGYLGAKVGSYAQRFYDNTIAAGLKCMGFSHS